jgi:hypothetical protein
MDGPKSGLHRVGGWGVGPKLPRAAPEFEPVLHSTERMVNDLQRATVEVRESGPKFSCGEMGRSHETDSKN